MKCFIWMAVHAMCALLFCAAQINATYFVGGGTTYSLTVTTIHTDDIKIQTAAIKTK
jgi:hypothetical protein